MCRRPFRRAASAACRDREGGEGPCRWRPRRFAGSPGNGGVAARARIFPSGRDECRRNGGTLSACRARASSSIVRAHRAHAPPARSSPRGKPAYPTARPYLPRRIPLPPPTVRLSQKRVNTRLMTATNTIQGHARQPDPNTERGHTSEGERPTPGGDECPLKPTRFGDIAGPNSGRNCGWRLTDRRDLAAARRAGTAPGVCPRRAPDPAVARLAQYPGPARPAWWPRPCTSRRCACPACRNSRR